ncbi:MAG TPA: serine/threonine-protein kinase [Myxococcaceae bacterium]|nr:serine/threonine-protein kinase [Myxococcaceae bacterium]
MPRRVPPPTPTLLPPGYEVGGWRLLGRCGRGSYGTVYRACWARAPDTRHFALKLATSPRDPRFEREVELLSRVRHPNVPRLHDRGWWVYPNGVAYPFLVMDWVEGVPLYAWASMHPLTSRQVLRLLGQLARALEATHQARCVHRDVKGDNVLVSPQGDAFLVDFGAGSFEGANQLTTEVLPPSTAQYLSPQARRFQLAFRRLSSAHYEPTPADDVYALGVLAYYLVTGTYPLPVPELAGEPEPHLSRLPPPRPPAELATVCPALNALILRMLCEEPRARGSAGELGLAAEKALASVGPEAERPVALRPPRPRSARYTAPRPLVRLAAAGLAVALALGVMSFSAWLSPPSEPPDWSAPAESDVGLGEGDSSGVTESAMERAWMPSVAPSSFAASTDIDVPTEPFADQRRPPCRQPEVEIRGGCWLKLEADEGECYEVGYSWRWGCYVPSPLRPRPATSAPR